MGQNYSILQEELKYLIDWDKNRAQQHIICILYATYPILVYKVVNYISNYILHKKGIITGIALIMLTFTTEDLMTDCPIIVEMYKNCKFLNGLVKCEFALNVDHLNMF